MTGKMFHLLQKHQGLDERLRIELARRWPDSAQVQKLKKLKLAVKDALAAVVTGRQPSRG